MGQDDIWSNAASRRLSAGSASCLMGRMVCILGCQLLMGYQRQQTCLMTHFTTHVSIDHIPRSAPVL